MQEDLLFDGEGELHETSQLLLEMKETLFHALLRSGVVGKVRAQLRASALGLLRGDGDLQNISTGPTFAAAEEPLTSQVSLLLVMDFLQQHHLTHTAGVLAEEGSAAFVESAAKRRLADTMELFPGDGSMLERILQPLLETERTEMMRTDQQQQQQQQQPTSSTAKVVLHPTEVPTLEELTISRDGERSSILGSTTAVEDDNPGEDDGYQHHLPPPPPPDNIAAKLRLCEESLSFVDSVGEVSTRDGDVVEEMR